VTLLRSIILLPALLIFAGCSKSTGHSEPQVIRIDGSSTVFPIAEAVAEEFQLADKTRTRVTVGLSGTGGGFKKLCRGEIDIANASRPILTDEMEKCRTANIRYIELPIAFDAITVVVNPHNQFVKSLTVSDLKKMWEPAAQGQVLKWNQVRPEWPDTKLMLFGPGADSGTFDYFTEAITGKAKSSRGDFTASEDDNVLVQGVESNNNALGYFGFAYYAAHKDRMRVVPIDNGKATVAPSIEAVLDGSYQPLARPLFIYITDTAAQRPEVRAFIQYFIKEGSALTREVGFVPLNEQGAQQTLAHFQEARLGTVFGGVPAVGVTIDELLKREARL
jgi:phosphate transport system substrate-binding protein